MNSPQRRSVFLVFALVASQFTFNSATASTEIPFKLHGHLVVVEASIGEVHDLAMVVDTGATFSLISPSIAKRLGLKTKKKEIIAVGREVTVKESVVENLKVGEVEFQQVSVRVGKLPQFKGLKIDGLIGLDVLRNTNWTFDFVEEKLIAGWTDQLAGCQSFYPGLAFIPVRLNIGGAQVTVMLDTGTDKLMLFGDKVQDRVKMVKTTKVQNLRHVGGSTKMRRVLLSDVSLGDSSWKTREAHLVTASGEGYSGTGGIMGPMSLGLKQLHLDFQNNRVGIQTRSLTNDAN